ncbi:MAG: hypothetical protein N2037_10165 [Acidimicrobiales bacterium]|nr:hypothetical protein [Acidimicrobiales bacterium]
MPAISSADQLARLNILASGGSGALAEFDKAKSAADEYYRRALGSVLGPGRMMGTTTGAEQRELYGLVDRMTTPYRDDAASAANLATAQVGYDRSAVDAYLANQQKILDENLRQHQQQLALDRQELQEKLDLGRSRLNAYLEETNAMRSSLNSGGLSAGETDAIVTGIAQLLQDRRLDRYNARVGQMLDRRDRIEDRLQKARENENAVLEKWRRAGFSEEDINQIVSGQRKPEVYPWNMQEQLGKEKNSEAKERIQADTLLRLKQYGQAHREISKAVQARQRVEQMRDRLMPKIEKEAERAATKRMALANALPMFQQQAARLIGIDPIIAAGKYPWSTADREEAIFKAQQIMQERDPEKIESERIKNEIDKIRTRQDAETITLAQEIGIPFDRAREIVDTVNLPVEDVKDMLRDEVVVSAMNEIQSNLEADEPKYWDEMMDSINESYKFRPEVLRVLKALYRNDYELRGLT